MAPPIVVEKMMMMGANTLGNTCLQMMTAGETPAILASITKSASLTESTSPLIIRAIRGHVDTATATTMGMSPVPRIATIIIASRMDGKPIVASAMRMMIVSTHLPA